MLIVCGEKEKKFPDKIISRLVSMSEQMLCEHLDKKGSPSRNIYVYCSETSIER